MLAASKAGLTVAEYAPTEVKLALVGFGRAEKAQVQQMVALLLGLDTPPTPHDASDALAIAVCHANRAAGPAGVPDVPGAAGAAGPLTHSLPTLLKPMEYQCFFMVLRGGCPRAHPSKELPHMDGGGSATGR